MKNKNAKDIATRMKEYEKSSKHHLTPRVPVMLRIDGRAFHTFTKGFVKPFDDEILLKAMRQTMKTLCEMISGCVLGYTQSDEITLVILDQNTQADPWFGYCQNKIESVAASMATMQFNREFQKAFYDCYDKLTFGLDYLHDMETHFLKRAVSKSSDLSPEGEWKDTILNNMHILKEKSKYLENVYLPKMSTAMFDCRAFNISKGEVVNNLIWRQQDASRNSVQQVAHTYFKHNELDNLSCDEIQEKLFQEKGINWSKYPARFKRGVCCVRKEVFISPEEIREHNPDYNEDGVYRNKWVLDTEIPIFTQDRAYILKFLEE